MATEKISLTLDKEALDRARSSVGKRGLSSYVSEALQLKLQHDSIRQMLEEMDEEVGPVSEEIRREAEELWPFPEKRRRSA